MTTEGKYRAGRSLAKDFHRLMKNIAGVSGGQARVTDDWEETALEYGMITVAIVPDSGLYKDGEFIFNIFCDNGYPEFAPDVFCKTPIYHPNIRSIEDGNGRMCLNMFGDIWSPSMTLEDVVQGILFLLHNPNLESPLYPFPNSMDEEKFANNVKTSLDGGRIGRYQYGYKYNRNRVTRGEDGEIVKDTNSPQDGAALCREEKPAEAAGEEKNATETIVKSAKAGWSLAKDFHRLMKNIASLSGGQARVVDWDETSLLFEEISVAVVPDSGLYKDGEFIFRIGCEDGLYPDRPPDVCCKTKIYHPNIDYPEEEYLDGRVYLDLLDYDVWSPSTTLEDVVQGILSILHNPNLQCQPSNIYFSGVFDEFADDVRRSLDGGWVDDYHFERNRVTRGEDGEIVRDNKSSGDGDAVCREDQEQPSKVGGEKEVARPDAVAENKTADKRKETGSGVKEEGETGVIGVG